MVNQTVIKILREALASLELAEIQDADSLKSELKAYLDRVSTVTNTKPETRVIQVIRAHLSTQMPVARCAKIIGISPQSVYNLKALYPTLSYAEILSQLEASGGVLPPPTVTTELDDL